MDPANEYHDLVEQYGEHPVQSGLKLATAIPMPLHRFVDPEDPAGRRRPTAPRPG